MFIRELLSVGRAEGWLSDVPGVQALQATGSLGLSAPLTVLTGDNGVGKSTLLEAIAAGYGFPRAGGPVGVSAGGLGGGSHSLLPYISLVLGERRKVGYFLRAETHFALGKKFGADGPGFEHMHRKSHGESVIDLLSTFPADGLYLLDEPESGLSPVRQMAAVGMLGRLLLGGSSAGAGLDAGTGAGAQIVMVTHSAIMLSLATAVPGARIVEITADGQFNTGLELEDTIAFRAMDDFLADPTEIARYMCEVTSHE
ncbi:hypothetical protein CCYS_13730 [Corynebacterium cystitidis DSM 20524]|uniref:Predicted ATPase n=1 Tax=Corynebacterium cystitidis DSM 20524 TaxID=1121357 RepID=A0A1H9UYV0_9CORY|nr:hypothetical protein CCYS_13730 [Corynebacterium cystitidis DSM 20524]SES14665.1 Predicted ATPase [Corynebacterium cystitidis DSM 20524]SNV91661.1 ABC transporter [Corynebacterium cystitidis]